MGFSRQTGWPSGPVSGVGPGRLRGTQGQHHIRGDQDIWRESSARRDRSGPQEQDSVPRSRTRLPAAARSYFAALSNFSTEFADVKADGVMEEPFV